MGKTYKIAYKVYFNEKLKPTVFHGRETYPLYIQVTHLRRSNSYKSQYFDLLSSPKYLLLAAGHAKSPSLEDVIKLEEALLGFIAETHAGDFSLNHFKYYYDYYGLDLCSSMEQGFVDYLHTFFEDKGRPALASVLREGLHYRIAHELVRDMKGVLAPKLYEEMLENSHYYAPPYLPVYGYMKQARKWPLLLLTVREWLDAEVRADFSEYLSKRFADHAQTVLEEADRYVAAIGGDMSPRL